MQHLRRGTSATVAVGTLISKTDGITVVNTAVTHDMIFIVKNSGTGYVDSAPAARNLTTAPATPTYGTVLVPLNTTDTGKTGRFKIIIQEASAGSAPSTFRPIAEVFEVLPESIYDAEYGVVAGTSATTALSLTSLGIVNPTGIAVTITGGGAYPGLQIFGGAGATGNAVDIATLSTNGHGIAIGGKGTGAGIIVRSGTGSGAVGVDVASSASAGDGYGFKIAGSAVGAGAHITSGTGATGNGVNIFAASTNGTGLNLAGTGNATGASITSGTGADSIGLAITSSASSGLGNAININGSAVGHGIRIRSGSGTTGDGLNIASNAANGIGINVAGVGTGDAVNLAGGSASGCGILSTGGGTGNGVSIKSGAGNAAIALLITSVAASGAGHGISCVAVGSGSGIASSGGLTGHGLYIAGGATSGDGLRVIGAGTGSGAYIRSGAGATGNAVDIAAASTNGKGLNIAGTGTGHGMSLTGGSTSGSGLAIYGGGTGRGVYVNGGATGPGVSIISPANHGMDISGGATGVYITGVSGDAVQLVAQDVGNGLYCAGGDTAGYGIKTEGRANNAPGLVAIGAGTGAGAHLTGGTSGNGITINGAVGAKDISAKELETLITNLATVDTVVDTIAGKLPATTVSSSVEVQAIQNNTQFVCSLPETAIIPTTGSYPYKVNCFIYDEAGSMEDPDNNDLGVALTTPTGVSLANRLFKEATFTNLLDTSSISGYVKMERDEAGKYHGYYKASSTDSIGQMNAIFKFLEGGIARLYGRQTVLVSQEVGTTILADSDLNKTVIAKAIRGYNSSAIAYTANSIFARIADNTDQLPDISSQVLGVQSAVDNVNANIGYTRGDIANVSDKVYVLNEKVVIVDSVVDGIAVMLETVDNNIDAVQILVTAVQTVVQSATYGNSAIHSDLAQVSANIAVIDSAVDTVISKLPSGTISDLRMTDAVDGTFTLAQTLKLLAAMAGGRFKTDTPNIGQITYYARDNVTPVFIGNVSATERTRV